MINQKIRTIVYRYWEAAISFDLDKVDEFYHNDVVVEYPQTSKRILRKHDWYELGADYPVKVVFKILRVRREGNLWVSEIVITCIERPVNAVFVREFGDEASY